MVNLEIRQLSELDEFSNVVRLQRQIWGFEDVELLPRRLFVVASKIGGQLLGAFDGPEMVAFCLCIPGLKPGGKPYLHSHMLGVQPSYRNTGLGRRMKLAQRDYALANNIDLVEWTFDPLEIKNAFFNIERLGAIVRRYVFNQYGTTTSHLHGGLPTDRLIAEWWIEDPPRPEPGSQLRIEVPTDIDRLRTEDPSAARAIQSRVSEQFDTAFREGLAVTGFRKTSDSGIYLLQPWPSK